jgi:phosphoglycolate phosphatase
MSLQTVLLDLDGTLADTLPDLSNALNRALGERNLAPLDPRALRPVVSRGSQAMVETASRGQLGDDELARLRERFLAIYGDNIARRSRLMDGMDALLEELEERGLAWGIVTNKLEAFTGPLVEALGIHERAACIVSGDTAARAKPHPDPLLHACALTGTAPTRCVYVGDARNDVLAGQRAGMATVVALFGYIADGEDPQSWGADGVIRSPGELLEVIRDW